MRRLSIGLLVALLLAGSELRAQQRPLVTQDPEVIGEGRLLIEAGIETGANLFFPVSGLTGDHLAAPIGVSLGIGKIVELQIDSGLQTLAIELREPAPLSERVRSEGRATDVLDATIATKLRIVAEGERRPAIGVRFATTLPNASNESGLGLDILSFSAALLVGKTIGSVRVVGNAGVALLSDVLEGSLQDDAFVGGVSLARAVSPSLEVVGEIAGQRVLFADVPPVGAEPRGAVRGAIRYTRGGWRADAGVLVGLTRQDPDFGFTLGLTWVARVR